MSIYSSEGSGTIVYIYLPQATGEVHSPIRLSEDKDTPRGDETILLVEDDASVRKATVEILRQLGYTVMDAAGGTEALELARASRGEIDLMLTDVVMPGMSGRELAEIMGRTNPEVKVLFFSGYTDEVFQEQGMAGRSVEIIRKPFSLHSLATKVRQALDKAVSI